MKRLVSLLVALTALSGAILAAEPQSRADVQTGIGQLVRAITTADRADDAASFVASADRLREIADDDRELLLSQLVLYLATHPGNEPAMGTAVLIDYYDFSDGEKVGALAPLIGADDARVREAVWDVLLTVESPPTARASVERVQEVERSLARGAAQAKIADAIGRLSSDELWWIRLYAAHAVSEHPELATPDVRARLRSDDDARVRVAAGG